MKRGRRPSPRGGATRKKNGDGEGTAAGNRRAASRPQQRDVDLEPSREHAHEDRFTTDQGIPISHTDDSLKAGVRGPTLLEDFHFREKLTRFDHERIPERVVHARGSGAYGWFQVYESLEDLTSADFLCDPSLRTPAFVRFSTVVGSRGSADTVRDVRGFAVKLYTREGNFDLVGNNIPVFFIQDGIKFPDLVHAIKPEPHHEMPQASSAHDTFWDFVSLTPETMHMVMWLMSDRALPRSYRMMDGFGVHTFRLTNRAGDGVLCKFHWKPLLGAHSMVWDEAQKLAGRDPDFHRRDLWEAIESGNFPEYELALQIIPEADERTLGFDLLDPTKLVPEEVAPLRRVGKLTLDRNPKNFFAETEQVAFCIANVPPGVGFTDDPLLQARLFSYLDTQLSRLGGPNFVELPVNRPSAPVANHQQDGISRKSIPTSRALYHPNSIEGGAPALAAPADGYLHAPVKTTGARTRERSESFADHFTQARLFLHSQSPSEYEHLVDACRFEIGKVERLAIRERVVALFRRIDEEFAREVADAVGVTIDGPAPRRPKERAPSTSPALSLESSPKPGVRTRKIAILLAEGFNFDDVDQARAALTGERAEVEIVAPTLGIVRSEDGGRVEAMKTLLTSASVFYDAVYVPGGFHGVGLLRQTGAALYFVREAFRHSKTLGATNEGIDLLLEADLPGLDLALHAGTRKPVSRQGVVTAQTDDLAGFLQAFIDAVRRHRHFDRASDRTPA